MFFLKSQELFSFLRQSTRADVTPQISGGVKHAVPLPSDIRVISDFKLRVSLLNDSLSGSFIIFFSPLPAPAVSHFFYFRAGALTAIHVVAADWLRRIKPLFVPPLRPPPAFSPLVYCLPLTAFASFYVSLSLVCVKSQRRRDFLFFNRLNSLAPRMLNATRGAKQQLYGSIKASHLLGDFFIR